VSGQLVFNSGNQRYELISEDFGSFTIDFSEREYKRPHRGSQELIAKACGLKKGIEAVLDLTAGLGEDSVFLARLGFEVHAVERNPLIFALLDQAWKTAGPDFPTDRLCFYFGSALDLLPKIKLDPVTTALYFDPMFPEKKKSALPRKEMQIFKTVVGEDPDAAANLEKFLILNFKRVVVKRPLKADVLVRKPEHQFLGKTIRYDVYMAKG
jgi:16S rRNA (guanine1516-N2)-methyltransferase